MLRAVVAGYLQSISRIIGQDSKSKSLELEALALDLTLSQGKDMSEQLIEQIQETRVFLKSLECLGDSRFIRQVIGDITKLLGPSAPKQDDLALKAFVTSSEAFLSQKSSKKTDGTIDSVATECVAIKRE